MSIPPRSDDRSSPEELPEAGTTMSIADDDRSVLFAALAERSGLISAAEMDRALKEWAADRSRFIAEILVDLGSIDDQGKAAVDLLMRLHLSQHGNDAERSLEALSTRGSSPTSDGGESGEDSLRDLDADDATIDPLVTLSPGTPPIPAPPPPGNPAAGDSRFRVVRLHAKGGLGEVHLAHDQELDREVALKEIQSKFAHDPGSRARFLVEAKLTGNLEHPGIVPVYGLGRHADGRPYYAMRFVRGESLRDAIERFHRGEGRPKPPRERALRLRKLIVRFLAVCDAVDYAHSRGVIHRDIKPSNILLGPHGETLLVDWGLAKPLGETGPAEAEAVARSRGAGPEGSEPDATVATGPPPTPLRAGSVGSTERTRAGVAVGTPHFMSPEQESGDPSLIGPTSDVYSLGATLWTLVTGTPPGVSAAPEARRTQTGEKDSIHNVPRHSQPDPSLLAICTRAMAQAPTDRYPTARALADDLERWLADEPVSAHREPAIATLSRWSRKNQTWVAGALAALMVALASLGFISQARFDRQQARIDREVALAEAREAEKEAEAARKAERLQHYYALIDRLRQRSIDPEPTPGWTWEAREDLATASQIRPDSDPEAAVTLRTIAAGTLAAFDFRLLDDFSPGINPSCMAFSPDGKTLALGDFKARNFLWCWVTLFDWPSGKEIRRLTYLPDGKFQFEVGGQDGARRIAFDHEGRWVAVGTRSGHVVAWDLERERPKPLRWKAHQDGEVLGLTFKAGGDRPQILTTGHDGPLRLWSFDQPDGAPTEPFAEFAERGPVREVAVSGCGALAAVAGGRLYQLDPETLDVRVEGPEVGSDRLCWSPDGRMLAAGRGSEITIVSADQLQFVRRLVDPNLGEAHRHFLSGLAFHPDGSMLASACSHDTDRRVKFWDVSTGRLLGSVHDPRGSGYGVIDVAFDPGDSRLLASGRDRLAVVELWNHPAFQSIGLGDSGPESLEFSPDGSTISRLARTEEAVQVGSWSLPEGTWRDGAIVTTEGHSFVGSPDLAIDATGDRVAFSGAGPRISLWSPGQDQGIGQIELEGPSRLLFSSGGQRLWCLFNDRQEIGCWDLDRQELVVRWFDKGAEIVRGLSGLRSLAVSEPWVVAGGRDGLTRVLQVEEDDLNLIRQWDHKEGPVETLALRPDALLVASGTAVGSIVLIPLPDGVPSAPVTDAHPGGVFCLAMSPDGRMLASGGADRTIKLWRIEGNELVREATIAIAQGPVLDLAFSPDGRTLAAAIQGELALRVWQLDRLNDAWKDLGIDLGS